MKNVGALFDVQGLGDFAACMLQGLAQHCTGMRMPASRNLVSNILHLNEVRPRPIVGNEGSPTGDSLNIAFIVQFPQRTIGRHSGYALRFDQFVLGGDSIGRLQFTARNLLDDEVLELLITGFAGSHCSAPSFASASAKAARV